MQAPTSDQLRDRIDKGLTGEKINMPDPATVPLGTDAEAGGAPPTEVERTMDATASDAAASSQTSGSNRQPIAGGLIYLVLAFCIGAVVLAIVGFAAS